MQIYAIVYLAALSCAQAVYVTGFAGNLERDIASPDTRINLGQLQKAEVNVVGGTHRLFHPKHTYELLRRDFHETIDPEMETFETEYVPMVKSYPVLKWGSRIGSPKINLAVGSVSNSGQEIKKF